MAAEEEAEQRVVPQLLLVVVVAFRVQQVRDQRHREVLLQL